MKQVARTGYERKQAHRELKRFCLGMQRKRTVTEGGCGTGDGRKGQRENTKECFLANGNEAVEKGKPMICRNESVLTGKA